MANTFRNWPDDIAVLCSCGKGLFPCLAVLPRRAADPPSSYKVWFAQPTLYLAFQEAAFPPAFPLDHAGWPGQRLGRSPIIRGPARKTRPVAITGTRLRIIGAAEVGGRDFTRRVIGRGARLCCAAMWLPIPRRSRSEYRAFLRFSCRSRLSGPNRAKPVRHA